MSRNRMMESYKFKVGDRVRCGEAVSSNNDVKGKLGTIKVMIEVDPVSYGVEFDDRIKCGHKCLITRGTCRVADGHGWWCLGSSLEPADRSPLPNDIRISFEEMFNDAAET